MRPKLRSLISLLISLFLAIGATSAWADPAGRSVWVPPDSGYQDESGSADWGWGACTCNSKDYRGDYCATDRDPVCGGNPANQGGVWHWVTTPGYWLNYPPATVAANLSCTFGLAGWCVSSATVSVSGSELVAGYSITSIGGSDNGSPFSRAGALTAFSFGETAGRTLTYQAFSSFGDSSYAGSLTAKVDTTAPSVNASATGPAGLAGWYTGPVQIQVNASDGTSGVGSITLDGAGYGGPKTYSAQGSTTYSYSARDVAGNTSSTQSSTISIDSVPPAVSAALAGTPGFGGWYLTPVQVTVSGSDGGSGLAGLTLDGSAYSGPRTYSAQGVTGFTYSASDMAGNGSGTQSGMLRIDTAPPTASATQSGTTGNNGWYVSPVAVTVSASDSASGVASITLDGSIYTGPRTYTNQGNTTYTYSAQDVAGHTSTAQNRSFKIDTAAPAVNLALTGPTGANGWYTGPVQATVSGADTTSGLAGLSLNGTAYAGPRTVNAEGASTLTYAATDNAGNTSGQQSATVKIDSAPPAASYSLAGTPGDSGWFTSPVQVTVIGADQTSGVAGLTLDGAPYTGPRGYAAEGATTITYAAQDNAGNSSAAGTATFHIDTVPPPVTATVSGPAGDAGWYVGPVAVSVAGADATSGLAALTLDSQAYSSARTYAAQGDTTITFAGRDVAGNQAAPQTQAFKIDSVPPALAVDFAGELGRSGWYVSPVTVSVAGSDATSGLAGLQLDGSPYIAPRAYAGQGGTTIGFAGRDGAGNQAAAVRSFKVDTEPPTAEVTLSGVTGNAGWYVSPVTITAAATDATSGVDMIRLDGTEYTGPRVVAAQGDTNFTYSGEDIAGNTSATQSAGFRVDTAAPVVTATLAGQAGANGWYVSPVTVTVLADDATAGVARLTLDGKPYSMPAIFSAEGATTFNYAATDIAGNQAPEGVQTFRVDTQPPTTTATLVGLAGQGGWYLGPVLVILEARDAASGLDRVLLDGTPYLAPRLYPAGTITATFQAIDQAGNVEPAQTLIFNADETAPVTTAALDGIQGTDGWFTGPVTMTLSGRDDISGIARTWLNGKPGTQVSYVDDGEHTAAYFSEDQAGNRELTRTVTVLIDQTPPSVAVSSGMQTDGRLAIDVQAHDAGSGVRGGVVGILVDGKLAQWWNFDGDQTHIEWDGSLPDGRILPFGTFTLWAAAHDTAGLETSTMADGALAPATLPPTATLVPVSRPPAATDTPAPTPNIEPTSAEQPSPTSTQFATPVLVPTAVRPAATPIANSHAVAPAAFAPAEPATPAWWWWLATLMPALAIAVGAVTVVDPRPRALRGLAQLAEDLRLFNLGDTDD